MEATNKTPLYEKTGFNEIYNAPDHEAKENQA
jgi:hypothetical protein